MVIGRPHRRTAAKKGASVPDGCRRGTERRDCSACRNRRGCMPGGLQRLPFDDHSVGRFKAALSRRLAISEGCWNRGSPMTGPPNGHSIGGKNVRKRIPVILPIDQDRRLPLVSHGCRGGHTSGLPSKLHRPRGEGGSRLGSAVEQHLENLFEHAKKDRSKAFELKQELDRLGVFKDYEDRFLDLFKKPD